MSQQQIKSPTYLFTIGPNFSKSEKNFSLNPLTNVILLSATSNTLYLLTENQEIYFLHNENNQEITKLEVSKEYANDHTPVKFMSTGYDFLVIVKESNTIYGCGRNTFHQLLDFTEETTTLQTLLKPTNPFKNSLQDSLQNSLQDSLQNSLQNTLKDEYNPTLQNYLTSDLLEYNKITHLTCAGYGTIIILNESEIFNVGYYDSDDYSTDQFINVTPKMEKGQIIEKVTGGYFHFIVKYKNGNYYGFGNNGEGESNIGSNFDCKVLTQIIFPFLKPNERVIDGFALPISSMSCFITSNNDIYFCGYLRTKSNLLINCNFNCHSGKKCYLFNYEKLINNEKLNYERNEFQVFGAYASIFFLDKRNEIFYGDVEQFVDEPYLNLSKKVKEVDDNLLTVNRKVLSICCSNSSWGVLYGQIYSNNYMIMNLKKMSVGDMLFLSDLDFVIFIL